MNDGAEVVFCTYDSPASLGGPFTWLRRLLPELREAGIDCRVLALTHFGGTGPLVEGLRRAGFNVEAVDCHDRMEDQVRWILTQLQNSPPRVFIPNLVVSAYYAARWLKHAGAATIGVMHSGDSFYRALQDEFVLGDRAFRLTDIVSVSEKLHEDSRQRAAGTGCVAHYIPVGVHIPAQTNRIDTEPFRIVYVGRLAEEAKRVLLVTRTLIAATQELPWVEAVLYGDGPERWAVERMLADEGRGSTVRLAGAVSPDMIQSEMLQSQAIVLMSDYEGLPIALLEGMACGCIPICRVMDSGIPQLVAHQRTGLLVTDKSEDFITALRWLQTHPNQARAISENARQLIIENYSHQHSVECWTRLIRPHLSRKVGSFFIPRRLRLPPHRRELESDDSRRMPEPAWLRRLRRLRIWLGAHRRRILPTRKNGDT